MMAISSRLDLHPTDYAEIHSPTGSSEDSVEVKIEPICLNRNKRKLNEPKKTPDSILTTGPLKKRVCFKVKNDKDNNTVHPFRPWSPPPALSQPELLPPPSKQQTTNLLPPIQDQPVALIKKPLGDNRIKREIKNLNISALPPPPQLRVPVHPSLGTLGNLLETDRILLKTTETFPSLQVPTTTTTITNALLLTPPSTSTKSSTSSSSSSSIRGGNHHLPPQQQQQQQREQRNYKNMTRERRIEANARERTRVHTISAAFDTLRRSIPSYSHNQKLSKLSVLRIACSYIRTLSSIINSDDSTTAECVELVTKTIQKEGKLRKKKDDGD